MGLRDVSFALCVGIGLLCLSGSAQAQCTKDTDCKGERVCTDGVCVDAPKAPTPSPPANEEAPRPPIESPVLPTAGPAGSAAAPATGAGTGEWYSGYGVISGALLPGGGGEIRGISNLGRGDLESGAWGGVRVSGYWALTEHVHLGAYFAFFAGDGEVTFDSAGRSGSDNLNEISMGLSAKFGGRVHPRVWIGGGLDVGPAFVQVGDGDFGGGFGFLPAFMLDVVAFDAGAFKLGFHLNAGPWIVPYYEPDGGDEAWTAQPAIMLGVILGG